MQRESVTSVQSLVRMLEQEGVEYVFGIPGGPLMPFYEAMFDNGRVKPIISKHEEGAAFMADGYARVRGGLGVCCATTGPGATNALTGVACAHADSIPVMLVTAQVATQAFGKGAAQEGSPYCAINIVDMYRAVTKASLMLASPAKMADTVRQLVRQALSGRRGAVHLNIPADMMKREVEAESQSPHSYRSAGRCFDRRALKKAAELLVRARRPAILAGYGVYLSRAWPDLKRLAERLRVPVATTPKAKGIFPEDHLLSLGVLGFAGSPQAKAYFMSEEVDVLLAIGTGLGEQTTNCWDKNLQPREALIHADIDPMQIGRNYPVDIGLTGDAKSVLSEMRRELDRGLRWLEIPELKSRRGEIEAFKRKHPRCISTEEDHDESLPLKPQVLIREMEAALPRNTHIFVDIGNVMAWAIHYMRIVEPGTFHINLGFASMGHAVAGAIGGKLAAPDRPVVALVGDAAFAMNGMEVHTAVENKVPVIWVVMNNGGHGMVRHGERIQFKGKFQTGQFRQPLDIATIARGLGARTFRVEKPGEFTQAFAMALHAGEPAVLDVITDPAANPPVAMRIETLDRFFAGEDAPVPKAKSVELGSNGHKPQVVVKPTADLLRDLSR